MELNHPLHSGASGGFAPDMLPGFFGKLPARGDFLSRRVPRKFAGSWEAWLTSLTAAAKVAAGEEWPRTWLVAPVWHFALGSALAPPHGAAGVLIASADRVGRPFPFTIIGSSYPPRPDEGGALPWWDRQAETFAIEALSESFDPSALDFNLVELGPPATVTGLDSPAGATTPGDDGWSGVTALPGPNQSVWWSRGSRRVASARLRCFGLPKEAIAVSMVLGETPPELHRTRNPARTVQTAEPGKSVSGDDRSGAAGDFAARDERR